MMLNFLLFLIKPFMNFLFCLLNCICMIFCDVVVWYILLWSECKGDLSVEVMNKMMFLDVAVEPLDVVTDVDHENDADNHNTSETGWENVYLLLNRRFWHSSMFVQLSRGLTWWHCQVWSDWSVLCPRQWPQTKRSYETLKHMCGERTLGALYQVHMRYVWFWL